MSKETNEPAKKHHVHGHKHAHKHHSVKPHPNGEDHEVVNDASGQTVATFKSEDAAHEFVQACEEQDVNIAGPDEPIQ